jgi:histidyl-tRNA synthetase
MRCRYGGVGLVAADAEICAMLADTLEAVGIPRGDYIVRVNNRKVLNGVLEVAGLAADDDKEHERGIVILRAIDKLDKLGETGVRHCWARGARTRAAISRRARAWRRSASRAGHRLHGPRER